MRSSGLGKIERWRQTLGNRSLLESYYQPRSVRSADRGMRRALQTTTKSLWELPSMHTSMLATKSRAVLLRTKSADNILASISSADRLSTLKPRECIGTAESRHSMSVVENVDSDVK